MSGRGLFITFEGTEGSGKTTQVEMLGEWLAPHDPVVVREPGGTELGERIREVVLYAGLVIDAEAEMYLFMAARRQLISEVIGPALAGDVPAPGHHVPAGRPSRERAGAPCGGGQSARPDGGGVDRVSP